MLAPPDTRSTDCTSPESDRDSGDLHMEEGGRDEGRIGEGGREEGWRGEGRREG